MCELVCLCARVIGGCQIGRFVFSPLPRCLFHTSNRNCWIASSIWYATRISRSRIAASSRSNRSHALESISSRTSSSALPRTWNHGMSCFRILVTPQRVTPTLFLSAPLISSKLHEWEWVVGYRLFLMSFTSGWRSTEGTSARG